MSALPYDYTPNHSTFRGEPSLEPREIPGLAEEIEATVESYSDGVADLPALARKFPSVLYAICDYVLNQCDGGWIAVDKAIRADEGAMAQMQEEAIEELRRAA